MKHKYDKDKLYFSSGWVTADYRSADRNREIERTERKKQNADGLGELFQIIDGNEICSFAVFMRYIYKHYPNLRELAVQNHSLLRGYISDKRFDVACGFADMDYKQVCNELKSAKQQMLDYEESIVELRQSLSRAVHDREQLALDLKQKENYVEDTNRLNRRLLSRLNELQEMLEFEKIF